MQCRVVFGHFLKSGTEVLEDANRRYRRSRKGHLQHISNLKKAAVFYGENSAASFWEGRIG